MKRKRKAALAAPTALAAFVATMPMAGAQVDEGGDPSELVTRMESVPGSAFRQTGNAKARDNAAREFLNESARQGRLLDRRSVRSAVSPAHGSLAWDGNEIVDEVRIVTGTDPNSGEVGARALGMKVGHGPDDGAYGAANVAQGLGMSALSQVTNGDRRGGHCSTYTHEDGHKMTSCWEKWKLVESSTTRDNWVYNRWGTALARGDGFWHNYTVKELTLRSRPWSGTKGRVAALVDYWPSAPGQQCAQGASVGIGVGVFSATLPFNSCDGTDTFANANTFELSSTWEGSNGTSAGNNAAIALQTWAGKELVMADYTWATFGDQHTASGAQETDNFWVYDTGW